MLYISVIKIQYKDREEQNKPHAASCYMTEVQYQRLSSELETGQENE